MVHDSFQCVWGFEFDAGDYVVTRTYNQKWGKGNQTYVFFNNSKTTYVNTHLMRAIKFPMTPRDLHIKDDDLIYKVSKNNEAMIYDVLREVEQSPILGFYPIYRYLGNYGHYLI